MWTVCSGRHLKPVARAALCTQLLCSVLVFDAEKSCAYMSRVDSHVQILERPEDRHFYFNSCRTPWRLAVYYS